MTYLIIQSFTLLLLVGAAFFALGILRRSENAETINIPADIADAEELNALQAKLEDIEKNENLLQSDVEATLERIDQIEDKIPQGISENLKDDIKRVASEIQKKQMNIDELGENIDEQLLQLSEFKKEQTQILKTLEKHEEKIEKAFSSMGEIKANLQALAERPFKPVPNTKDDLREIKGVGPETERLLNTHGIKKFEQIASLQAKDIKKLEDDLHFPDRIKRDAWVDQAKKILRERKMALESMGASPEA